MRFWLRLRRIWLTGWGRASISSPAFESTEQAVFDMGKLVAAMYRGLLQEGMPQPYAVHVAVEWMKWQMYLNLQIRNAK